MLQVGPTSWIDADSVVGVIWAMPIDRCPTVMLQGGHKLKATNYSVEDADPVNLRDLKVNALMAAIQNEKS